jgi:phosphoribosyl 1,2-cyclic phosphodiesterase
MVTLCAIASGSNGNCYYIGNEHDAVLIDAGISARRIIDRMRQQELNPMKVRAIFITHEHADHASGARVLAKRLQVPVFVTSRTFMAMYPNHKPHAPRYYEPGQEITVGTIRVHSFTKNHDAAEPCSFRVESQGIHTGVLTDIGRPCDNVTYHLGQCHALFLETNYDEKMLWEGNYPWPLKQRIASDHGHLSNDQAFELLRDHAGNQLQIVFLSHLSAENNTPDTAFNRFSELHGRYDIRMTSRKTAGEVVRMTEH